MLTYLFVVKYKYVEYRDAYLMHLFIAHFSLFVVLFWDLPIPREFGLSFKKALHA